MSLGEFELIARYFQQSQQGSASGVALGIGDDCALLEVPAGEQLAVSVDTLNEAIHFPCGIDPYSLGWRALAVNLSDLAAMGVTPRWFTLALTLPEVKTDWLQCFSQGLFALADQHGITLVGGDTTRGPLSITIQVMGAVPVGQALTRHGAKAGDHIYVSGWLGLAAAGLAQLHAGESMLSELEQAFYQPQPRNELGLALRGVAHSAIDVSDGLLQDLGHIAKASGIQAEISLAQLPMAQVLKDKFSPEQVMCWVQAGGDDYELCFTAPESLHDQLLTLSRRLDLSLHRIGRITEGEAGKVVCLDDQGQATELGASGYTHF